MKSRRERLQVFGMSSQNLVMDGHGAGDLASAALFRRLGAKQPDGVGGIAMGRDVGIGGVAAYVVGLVIDAGVADVGD